MKTQTMICLSVLNGKKTHQRKRKLPASQALLTYQPMKLEIGLNAQKIEKKENFKIKEMIMTEDNLNIILT